MKGYLPYLIERMFESASSNKLKKNGVDLIVLKKIANFACHYGSQTICLTVKGVKNILINK